MKYLNSAFYGTLRYLQLGLIIPAIMIVAGCQQQNESEKTQSGTTQAAPGFNQYKDSDLTVEVFKVDSIEHNGSRGWGYDIMVNGEIHIHQPNIPAVMGNNGFSSEEKARVAGEFVIQKIKNNILPPSVTPEELDSIGVLD